MRTIVIGLFIIALLAGFAAKMFKDSDNNTSFVRPFLNAIGYKKQRDVQREQIAKLTNQFAINKNNADGFIISQEQTLKDSRLYMSSLSQIIEDRLNRDTNTDLLRLKDLMQRFEDKTALLIEHGKQIVDFNSKQQSLNQKIAAEMDKANFASNVDRSRFMDNVRTGWDRQQDLLQQHEQQSQELQNTIQEISDKASELKANSAFQQDVELVQNLQGINDKTREFVDKSEQLRQKLDDIHQKNMATLESLKEKTENLKQKQLDAVERAREKNPTQTSILNDRLRNQLEKQQDRSLHRL